MLNDPDIIRDEKRCFFNRVLINARKYLTRGKRKRLNEQLHLKLKDINFSLFTNNCLGGVFYHDAGLRFTSPTINLAFDAEEYMKFLENPLKYKNASFEFYDCPGHPYPIARINGIEVRFVHYKTREECVAKWRERFERVVWDNIFVIATDHDGMYKDEWKERFDRLPYSNKIMFVATNTPKYDWEIPVRQFLGRNNVEIMTSFANFMGERYYETAFDIAKWIVEHSTKNDSHLQTKRFLSHK